MVLMDSSSIVQSAGSQAASITWIGVLFSAFLVVAKLAFRLMEESHKETFILISAAHACKQL
jgi:hypothetical protein